MLGATQFWLFSQLQPEVATWQRGAGVPHQLQYAPDVAPELEELLDDDELELLDELLELLDELEPLEEEEDPVLTGIKFQAELHQPMTRSSSAAVTSSKSVSLFSMWME